MRWFYKCVKIRKIFFEINQIANNILNTRNNTILEENMIMKFKIPLDIQQNMSIKQNDQLVLLISYIRYAIWLKRNAITFKEEQADSLDNTIQYCKGLLIKRLRIEKVRSNKNEIKQYNIQTINELINYF